MSIDLSIGAPNCCGSITVTEVVSSGVGVLVDLGPVSSYTDSDSPKVANDSYGYVVGDMTSKVAVLKSLVEMWSRDSAVWTGGDEPASSSFGSIDLAGSTWSVCCTTECTEELACTGDVDRCALVSAGVVTLMGHDITDV